VNAATIRSTLPTLCRSAWPAALAYLLASAYRINDQFWIQGLGAEAQSAMAAVLFVAIANFAVPVLAAAGALALVAQSIGAGDAAGAARASRHALALGLGLGLLAAVLGPVLVPHLAQVMALGGATARAFEDYLGTLYRVSPALFVAPVLDHVLIGRGRTTAPLVLQAVAIVLNYVLNALLVFGAGAAEALPDAPFVASLAELARGLGTPVLGIGGAAVATGISSGAASLLGLWWLARADGLSLAPRLACDRALVGRLLSVSAPVALSILLYALVYWALFAFVLAHLSDATKAGLGIGFQVFEGVAYPLFLGVAMAAGAEVGRAHGAGDAARVAATLRAATWLCGGLGLVATLAFLWLAEPVAAHFSRDARVQQEVVLYARVLALSQLAVAGETLWDKVLVATARTRAIAWITGLWNAARLPLAYLLAIELEWGASGLWWAINVTTYAKCLGLWLVVRRADGRP
jgi:MATE family multidrug resistance protein